MKCICFLFISLFFLSCQSKKKSPVMTVRTERGYCLITFDSIQYVKKYCDPISLRKDTCTQLTINTLIATGDSLLSGLINSDIDSVMLDMFGGSFKTVNDLVVKYDEDAFIEMNVTVRGTYKDMLTIAIVYSENALGASHTDHHSVVLTYNLKTGSSFKWTDMILPEKLKGFHSLGEKLFLQQNNAENWFYETGKFLVPEDFQLTEKGIYFTFDPYEIAPYSFGDVSLFFPFKSVSSYFKPEFEYIIAN